MATNVTEPGASGLGLYQTWLDSLTRLLEVRQPLSGDVTQLIRAWGEAVGQIGLVNFNIAGSKDPQTERRIGSRYSYGRQLGRMTEVLAPYIREHRDQFNESAGAEAVNDFLKMADDIEEMKQASVDDIVAKVRQWRGHPDFQQKLLELLPQLQALSPAPANSRAASGTRAKP